MTTFAEPTRRDRLIQLREPLDRGEIEQMELFGRAMTIVLENARFDPENSDAVWVEEDYCSPLLVMERAEVHDDYFTDSRSSTRALMNKRDGSRSRIYPGCGSGFSTSFSFIQKPVDSTCLGKSPRHVRRSG